MDAFYVYFNKLMNNNRSEFKDFGDINWLSPYRADEAEKRRDQLLAELSDKLNLSFKKTKPWINRLSKGCQLCGEGEWSCLFITGKCNASCFYCPTSQLHDELPTTQRVTFQHPEEYADYLNYFGFKGASFSGGEPFLVFDRTLSYLTAIRKKCSPDLYLWVYTNGLLATPERIKLLADAGINEIRFDIGATHFKLDHVRKAKGIIENITIEIPSVPEEKDRLIGLLPEIVEAGVTNLNLHQLRLTKHNAPKLLQRNYTYIQGEHPVVLESELAAYQIMNAVKQQNIDLGVNYCGFQYKNRFQKAAFRNKVASRFLFEGEELTGNGYARTLLDCSLSPKEHFSNLELTTQDYLIKNQLIHLNLADLKANNSQIKKLVLIYRVLSIENNAIKKDLNTFGLQTSDYGIESGFSVRPLMINEEEISELINLLSGNGSEVPTDELFFKIWQHEFIEHGMRPYY